MSERLTEQISKKYALNKENAIHTYKERKYFPPIINMSIELTDNAIILLLRKEKTFKNIIFSKLYIESVFRKTI